MFRLILWIGLAVPALSFAADSDFPKSRVLLEQRVQELKEESRLKGSAKADLLKAESDVKQALLCLDSKSPTDTSAASALVSNLSKSWKAVESADPKTIIDRGNPEFDALASAVESVGSFASLGTDCLRSLPLVARDVPLGLLDSVSADSFPRSRQSSAVSELVNQHLFQAVRDVRRKSASRLQSFVFDYMSEGRTRDTISPSKIAELNSDIASIGQLSETQKQTLTQLKDATKQLLSSIQNEIKSTEARISDIDKLLSQLDERLSTGSAATDKQLIIAVYMMIAALVFLFLGMKFIKDPLAEKIIENRSLVEVISMAFLLLTIIILGTGEKMPKDAIGTLLGSIAGYIFGRKMTENK